MDWLRKIVSGKRNRFRYDTYNLDVTYITPRIIAMSFPASGLEIMYRNNMNDVRIRWEIGVFAELAFCHHLLNNLTLGRELLEREAWKKTFWS